MITNRVSNRFGTVVPAKKQTATIHLVQSSRFAQRLAKLLVLALLVSIPAIALLPWQQTSRGTGQYIAYDPQERPQTVQAPTKGVVKKIKADLQDGTFVKKGEFLLEIQPFAANMLSQLESQLSELNIKLNSANAKAKSYELQAEDLKEARDLGVKVATEMISAAKAKLESTQRKVDAYESKERQKKLNLERQKELFEVGVKPAKEIEIVEREWKVANAELDALRKEISGLQNELNGKKQELEEKRRVAQTKIEKARAMQQDAIGSAATIRKEIGDLNIKLEELSRLRIEAPRDGTVYRLNVNELGDTVKEGDPLLTLVPKTTREAVELFINGNDMPLVEIGQEVRLQFEGWPAVQFTGWPSVAVGTFSGTVATVDPTDNGKGQFRILITPNEAEQPWPSNRFLRQGVRVNGWVMLRRVSLGYEIWRQLNGFPVIVSEKEPGKSLTKPPKIPK